MKLLTKQWYQTMIDSGLGVQVQIDVRTAVFSEELFREAWEKKLDAWLQMRKEACPIMEQIFDETQERELRIANGLDRVWIGRYSLHNSCVLSMDWEGEDLLVEFARDQVDWPEIKVIRFRDARILTQDREPGKAWWLYDEIWPAEGGYEIHALLWRDLEVFELTVHCRGTELAWTVPPKFKD